MRCSALLLAAALVVSTAAAQRSDTLRAPLAEDVSALVSAREAAERGHLTRLAVWGGASAVGGAALALASSRRRHPARWALGVQTAGWGLVNASIAAFGLSRSPAPVPSVAEAVRREDGFHDILLFNEGLNVAYVATGVTMAVAAARGVRGAPAWRGHGWAVVAQGAALLALDGIALAGSSRRLDALAAASVPGASVSVGVTPGGGVGATVRW